MDKLQGLQRWAAVTATVVLFAACGGEGGNAVTAAVPAAKQIAPRAGGVAQQYVVRNLPPNFRPGGTMYALNDNGQVCGYFESSTISNVRAAIVDGDVVIFPFGETHTTDSHAYSINAKGWITGDVVTDPGQRPQAFFYDGAAGTALLGTSGGDRTEGRYINDSGQVTGVRTRSDGRFDTFIYANGFTTYIVMADDVSRMIPGALNNAGQIAGFTQAGSVTRGFFYASGVISDIGGAFPGAASVATSMNDRAQVTGSYINNGVQRAYRYQDGALVDLGPSDRPSARSNGVAINASGQVTGLADAGSGKLYAFVHDGVTMKSLGSLGGALSIPNAINAAGTVVGMSSFTDSFRQHAFIWSPDSNEMIDLNDRIDPSLNIELQRAVAISNTGIILAYTGTSYVLLLPEPPPNNPPTLGVISVNDPMAVGAAVNVSAPFTDTDVADTHTASWSWGDGSATAGNVTEPAAAAAGNIAASHVYTTAGVYNISVTVTDSAGKSASVGGQVVVYDPNGGFVAGGGWINSPVGAYQADRTVGGRATFGFISKYLKGATKPSGQTEFQFQSANLNFHSSDYDWLVVGGARAQYKGTGTINGSGSYKFLLTAVDGDLIGKGTPDRLRMRIWHYNEETKTEMLDYDNQIDSGTEGGILEGTAIGGGSISIKTK